MDTGLVILLIALAGLLIWALACCLGAAFNTVSLKETFQTNFSAAAAPISSALTFPANSATATYSFTVSYGVGVGAGQINEIVNGIATAAASGSATLDLQTMADVLGVTAVLVRVKSWTFVLLSATQDATNGTACSSVVIQGGASLPCLLSLAGTTPTYTLNNGSVWKHADPGATGVAVTASTLNVKIANSDGALAMSVFYEFSGGLT